MNRPSWHSKAGKAWYLTCVSYAALLLVIAVDIFLSGAPLAMLVFLLPLLMFLPGMWRLNLRSYLWLCFVCLGYFLVLTERLFAYPSYPPAIIAMVAVVLLFCASMMFVRWYARDQRGA